MKNLILFHMESLSDLIFKLNDECFPNIKKWMQYAENYTNYYSTATSTLMVISDLIFGNMDCFEQAGYLEDIFDIECKEESIFSFLNKKGYQTQSIFCTDSDIEIYQKLHQYIMPNGTCWIGDQEEEIRDVIENSFCLKQPFAMFITDDASHVGYKGCRLLREEGNGTEWYKKRYKTIDSSVQYLFDLLLEKKLMENTVIVLYGDHGEEFFAHGLYEGYTHAIEPFTDMIKCPLFIIDGYSEYKENDNLISTVDVSEIIKQKLGFSEYKNIQRNCAYARNLYAAQEKRAEIFHKSYSVTDGVYLLLAKKDGISLYNNTWDPMCQMNLLNFFQFCHGELVYKTHYDWMISTHYKNIMTQKEKEEIIREFYFLRAQLSDFISKQKCLKKRPRVDCISPGNNSKKVIMFRYNKWKNYFKYFLKRVLCSVMFK